MYIRSIGFFYLGFHGYNRTDIWATAIFQMVLKSYFRGKHIIIALLSVCQGICKLGYRSPLMFIDCTEDRETNLLFSLQGPFYLFLPKIQPACSCLQGTHAVAVILPSHILHKWLQSLTKVCFITTICVCLYLLSFIYSSLIRTEIGSMYYSNYVCS